MPSVTQHIRRRRARKARLKESRYRSQRWSGLIIGLIVLAIVGPLVSVGAVIAFLYGRAVTHLPTQAQTLELEPILGTTELYDRSGGTLLYAVRDPLGDERRWLTLDELPEHVIQATLEMEDGDFLERSGFNLGTTVDRLWRYTIGLPLLPDDSLAARLVRNALLPLAADSNLDPLLLEIALTAEVQRRYTPLELLAWHLNTNDYGSDAYGIEAAARIYFNKTAAELTLDEAALLAPIPLRPQLNPFDDEVAARGRQADLLQRMAVSGRISQNEFNAATAIQTSLNTTLAQLPQVAPDFSLYAREQAEDILTALGLDGDRLVARGGLTITTSLDLDLYYQAECALRAYLIQLGGVRARDVQRLDDQPCAAVAFLPEPAFGLDQAALPDAGRIMIQDVQTGEIRTLVGPVQNRDAQPGPVLYPFVYLEGFLRGAYTPGSMLLDIPRPFAGAAEGLLYLPQNADGQFRGPLNLRDAMASGLRVPAVSVADATGLAQTLRIAHSMGINTLADEDAYDLSLLEMGGQVSLLDAAYAYSVFATQGYMVGVEPLRREFRARDPVAVLRIEDSDGALLWSYDEQQAALSRTNILGAPFAYLITDILADSATRRAVLGPVVDRAEAGRPAALVAGSSGDGVNNWALGYTPQRVLGVALGRDDGGSLSLDPGGWQGAAPLWAALLRYTHERDNLSPATWTRPDAIAEYVVCERSGMTPGEDSVCPTRNEFFLREVPPFQQDIHWQRVIINSNTGLLATLDTPPNLRVEQRYFIPPEAARDWWMSNGLPLPPTERDRGRPDLLRDVNIVEPAPYAYVSGNVDVYGTIETLGAQSYQLSYGEGIIPTQWFNITGAIDDFSAANGDLTRPLATWDTTRLAEGIYTVQMAVRTTDGTLDTAFVQVTVDNVPPSIELSTAGEPNRVYRFPTDQTISLVATVTDNLSGYDRVIFYRNGQLVGEDQDWPFFLEVDIRGPGLEGFSAIAYDQAGNEARAEIQVEVIRSGG